MDYRTEISISEDTTHKRPENVRAWTQLGVSWLEAGNREKAFECFDRAIRLNSHYADAYHNRSIANGRADRWDLALQDSDTAVRLNPDSAPYHSSRGVALAALGRYAEAIGAYDREIALDPTDAGTWYNRGNAHARLRQFDEAAKDYNKALALGPDALIYQNRGNLWLVTNRNRQAVEDYNRAIALNPRLATAYHNRAIAYSKLGSFDRAWADERMFEKLGGRPNPELIKTVTPATPQRSPNGP
jgi:tetratricopeptide (TPR) repeat protein